MVKRAPVPLLIIAYDSQFEALSPDMILRYNTYTFRYTMLDVDGINAELWANDPSHMFRVVPLSFPFVVVSTSLVGTDKLK